jgi:putative nucleotidyltransferase with HDIG domain
MGMREELLSIFPEIQEISDKALRDQVLAAWEMATKRGGWVASDIKRIPFTLVKKVDITFDKHVKAVTRICMSVADIFDEMYQGALKLDRDIILAGALLHDVGKMLEIEEIDGKFQKSANGKLVRHPFSGLAIADACGLPDAVLHIIGTHSKEGDPFKRTPEAIVLNYADFMNFDPIEG